MHFTFEKRVASDDLQQGDVISRTQQLDAVLKDVHPHYFYGEDYRYFLVLTQSCDLVRRPGYKSALCKSRYITLAAIRPLEKALRLVGLEPVQNRLENAAQVLSERKKANSMFHGALNQQ